ncbi:uncharacterized protein [Amphiura filiformis]|uniref:uncharacterized protein n=1 Tax=Amphiura filiformis TaxID=82378 RepID=UPI003B21E988
MTMKRKTCVQLIFIITAKVSCPFQFVTALSSIGVPEGENATLECTPSPSQHLRDGITLPKLTCTDRDHIHWIKIKPERIDVSSCDKILNNSNGRIAVSNSSTQYMLHIANVQESDQGMYECYTFTKKNYTTVVTNVHLIVNRANKMIQTTDANQNLQHFNAPSIITIAISSALFAILICGVCTLLACPKQKSVTMNVKRRRDDDQTGDESYKDLTMEDMAKGKYTDVSIELCGTSQMRHSKGSCIYEVASDEFDAPYINQDIGFYYNTCTATKSKEVMYHNKVSRGKWDVDEDQDAYDIPE